MEINKINGDILGVVVTENMVEGRMVCMTSHTYNYDFGSLADLPGVKLPGTADEAKRARFMVAFAEENRPTPIYRPYPTMDWAMRNGFSRPTNVPFTTSVYLTQPNHMLDQTIYSGATALAYGAGTYTVSSGQYISSAGIGTPGTLLSVSYASDTKGQLQVQATWDTDLVVAVVERLDSATQNLTVKTGLF